MEPALWRRPELGVPVQNAPPGPGCPEIRPIAGEPLRARATNGVLAFRLRALPVALWLPALLAPLACAAEDEKTPFECALGTAMDGAFVDLSETPEAELQLGTQGFLFIDVLLEARGDVPPLVEARIGAVVEGESEGGERDPVVELQAGAAGVYGTDDLQAYFDGTNIESLVGKRAQIEAELSSPTHSCSASGAVILVDHDDCLHSPEGPVCPDDPG